MILIISLKIINDKVIISYVDDNDYEFVAKWDASSADVLVGGDWLGDALRTQWSALTREKMAALRVSVSLARKHDGKRFKLLSDHTMEHGDYDKSTGEGYFYGYDDMHFHQARHDLGPTQKPRNSFPAVVSASLDVHVKKVTVDSGEEESVDSWTLDAINLELSSSDGGSEDCPIISSLDGILQMLECPCYAELWR